MKTSLIIISFISICFSQVIEISNQAIDSLENEIINIKTELSSDPIFNKIRTDFDAGTVQEQINYLLSLTICKDTVFIESHLAKLLAIKIMEKEQLLLLIDNLEMGNEKAQARLHVKKLNTYIANITTVIYNIRPDSTQLSSN